MQPPATQPRPTTSPSPSREADIRELEFGSDFTAFLGAGVANSEHRAALRHLWTTSGIFGRNDGLDVYCGDYTTHPQDAETAKFATSRNEESV